MINKVLIDAKFSIKMEARAWHHFMTNMLYYEHERLKLALCLQI